MIHCFRFAQDQSRVNELEEQQREKLPDAKNHTLFPWWVDLESVCQSGIKQGKHSVHEGMGMVERIDRMPWDAANIPCLRQHLFGREC